MKAPRSVAERVYATMLLLHSRPFRERYGSAAASAFGELHAEAAARGIGAVMRLWLRTVAAVVAGGVVDRLEAHREGGPRAARGRGEYVRDARIALRTIGRRPSFALTAIVMAGLGIGATTTIFSVVYGVLLRPLPYPDSQRLVTMTKDGSSVPVPDFVDVRAGTRTLDGLGAVHTVTADLTGSGDPERLGVSHVSDAAFDLLGVHAYRGRLFASAEYEAGRQDLAVLSMGLWTRRFGADESVIGHTLTLNGRPVTVIGVVDPEWVPPEAIGLDEADLFMPLDLARDEFQNRHMFILSVVGRINPGANIDAVRADMESLGDRFRAEGIEGWVDRNGDAVGMVVDPLREITVAGVDDILWMFLGAVALMLMIACANVANLFLARATERTHEMAVRAALGAGRRRLVSQLLTESTTLALAGGVLGVLFAAGGVYAFLLMDPGGIPRTAEVELNAPVLLFAILLSVLTGIAFGIAPALSSAGTRAASAMRETGLATTASRSRSRLRGALVTLQLAMALVLLAGAGVLFNSFIRLRGVETGFEPDDLLTVQLDTEARVPAAQRAAFVHRLEQSLAALPGVEAVGTSWRLPFDRGRCCWSSRVHDPTVAGDTVGAYFHPVTADYFAALGADLVEGRFLEESDASAGEIAAFDAPANQAATMPVVISSVMAERLWPGRSAVGRSFRMGTEPTSYDIVGVVRSIRHWRLNADFGPDVYIPFDAVAAWDLGLLDIAIRHDRTAAGLAGNVRDVFLNIDDQLPLDRIVPMVSRIAGSIATPRFYAILLGTFAALAFLLAASGIYSSMLYVVGLRRRELGIRAALGAARADLLRLVLVRGVALVITGATLGIGLSLAAARVLENLTFGVSPTDPTTLALAALLLGVVGLAACWLPARRAARADPVATLRSS